MEKEKKNLTVMECEQCGTRFKQKKEWQKFCKQSCRQASYMAKKDAVIKASKELVVKQWESLKHNKTHAQLEELFLAVCDLEGWNKDGERPSGAGSKQ